MGPNFTHVAEFCFILNSTRGLKNGKQETENGKQRRNKKLLSARFSLLRELRRKGQKPKSRVRKLTA